MNASATRRLPAPSHALLRFLRRQNEEFSFFTPNRFSPESPVSRTLSPDSKSKTSIRRLTTSSPKRAVHEASILNFDVFRSSPPTTRTTSSSDQLTRYCIQSVSSSGKTRGISTQKSFLSGLWARDQRDKSRPGDPSPFPNFLDDIGNTGFGGRGKLGKAGNVLKLRCTEIDENGNVITVNGEFKKSELVAKYGLPPRDLRKIDSSVLPHIIVRPAAILVNLLHLRVLIKNNCVLVLDAYGSTDSHSQSQFMYDLCGRLSQKESSWHTGGLPYELRALEAVLVNVTTGLETEFEGISEPVVRVLRELEEDIDRDKLRHLLIYSKKIGTFEQKARLVRDAIDDLLEVDEDLNAMYLSERAQSRHRDKSDHTEVEMLLESYHKVCDEIVQEAGNLVNNIRNTEEVVKAILDANRNSLMLLDLKFSIGTLGIGGGAFIASLYGMNLKNFIEESDLGFAAVTVSSAVFAAVVWVYGLKKLRRVQRVSMWGERGGASGSGGSSSSWHRGSSSSTGGGSWRDVRMLGEGRIERDRAERVRRIKELKREAGIEASELKALDSARSGDDRWRDGRSKGKEAKS